MQEVSITILGKQNIRRSAETEQEVHDSFELKGQYREDGRSSKEIQRRNFKIYSPDKRTTVENCRMMPGKITQLEICKEYVLGFPPWEQLTG